MRLFAVRFYKTALQVRESLYPLNFLRELAALERARQEFLVGGSDASAKIYEQQLSVAVAAYKKDLAAYKMVVAVVAKDNENLARQALSPKLSGYKLSRTS